MNTEYNIYPLGDSGIVVSFGEVIHPTIHTNIQQFIAILEANRFEGMIEYVPAFTTVTIYYKPHYFFNRIGKAPYEIVKSKVEALLQIPKAEGELTSRIVEIPVCYGDEFGPDLAHVANYHQLTEEEVIKVHSSGDYLVYMIGFAPGFPYLGGMDERLATPRKEKPQASIPKGSVGIAGGQTGIYPLETPGGWQIIGRTPLSLFNPLDHKPVLLQAGDSIRFIPITKEEYVAQKEGDHEY